MSCEPDRSLWEVQILRACLFRNGILLLLNTTLPGLRVCGLQSVLAVTWERRWAVVLQRRVRLSSAVVWLSHLLKAGKLDSQSGRTLCSRRTSSCRLATLDRREPLRMACSALSASRAPTSLICTLSCHILSRQ